MTTQAQKINLVNQEVLYQLTGYTMPSKIENKLREAGIHYIRRRDGSIAVTEYWLNHPTPAVSFENDNTEPNWDAL